MAPKFKKSGLKSNRVCCVEMCNSRDDGKISFHRFPKAGIRVAIKNSEGEVFCCDTRKVWEDRVGDDVEISPKRPFVFVCSLHFTDDDYSDTSRLNTSHKHLRRTAVPTQRLPYENSAFDFNPPTLLGQNYVNNNNNNNVHKSVKRMKRSRHKKKKETHAILENRALNEETTDLINTRIEAENTVGEDTSSLGEACVILEDSSLSEETGDNETTNFPPEAIEVSKEDRAPVLEKSVIIVLDCDESSTDENDNETKEQLYKLEDDLEIEEMKLDDATKMECEECEDIIDPFADQKDTKEDVDTFLDMALMHTSFELEKLSSSGIFVPFLSRCN